MTLQTDLSLPTVSLKRGSDAYQRLLEHTKLQLAAAGLPAALTSDDQRWMSVFEGVLANARERIRRTSDTLCPADQRIEAFLNRVLGSVTDRTAWLPRRTMVLDQYGMARVLSIPADGDLYRNPILESYRVKNGVLHNPAADRRTTAGTFHVVEGGLPIPGEKKSVPPRVFAAMIERALGDTPPEMLTLPLTIDQPEQARTLVSLYLRPIVVPEVVGVTPRMRMETRLFVPGGLVSNLDFVESIFGNAGDPMLPENDAGLDAEHWTGHTGCVILAPHLTTYTKKELGLPHVSEATDRQRRDKMCYEQDDELYNDGVAFKLTCRDQSGVVVTLIADNYFGYCKKEVKTQISYAANLMGNAEEEHAGGAVVFPSYSLGDRFASDTMSDKRDNKRNTTFQDVVERYRDDIDLHDDGYAVDKTYPDLIYLPGDAQASLATQKITWTLDGQPRSLPLLPSKTYMLPSGYRIRLAKHPGAPTWRLIGTRPEGVFCHKPCTVSGGGKSEISKSLVDYMHYGPIFVSNLEDDFAWLDTIFNYDFQNRWRDDAPEKPDYSERASRPILSPNRSLGSVIKLLTPSSDYTDAYNTWLRSIPNYILAQVYAIKRFEPPVDSSPDSWRQMFSVDFVNGFPGHELKYRDRKIIGSYLRVGFQPGGGWRTFKLRQDFVPAVKVQTEDDITASIVVPKETFTQYGPGIAQQQAPSVKFIENCELRLFQRPDEAIHRGFDKQTESDLAGPDNFISNFEPLTKHNVRSMAETVIDFAAFSSPMQTLLQDMLDDESSNYVVCSANPRQIDGKLSKNPRYLQTRLDLIHPHETYMALQGARIQRAIPSGQPVPMPVNAVLMGRRNNPPDKEKGIRMLAVYNPIHYQELPELFMDLMASLSGKSPSTTGFGSEGALTKGPFNMLRTAADLNAAFLSYVLTGLAGFSTPAGHIGPNYQIDHDISLLVPEIWCRIYPDERDPADLIAREMLEPLVDQEVDGEVVPVSRLGYRITKRFCRHFLGRIFDNPDKVFSDAMLRPETQDHEAFLDGVRYLAQGHKEIAQNYLADGTAEELVPPLLALVQIMAHGQDDQGRTVSDAAFRDEFTLASVVESDWYQERLTQSQAVETAHWQMMLDNLQARQQDTKTTGGSSGLTASELKRRIAYCEAKLAERSRSAPPIGFLGAQPFGTPSAVTNGSTSRDGRSASVTG